MAKLNRTYLNFNLFWWTPRFV